VRNACVQDVAYLRGDFLAISTQEASELLMTIVEWMTARIVNEPGLIFRTSLFPSLRLSAKVEIKLNQ
jgi:hypothetical protein